MSEDLTKKLPKTDSDKINLILSTVQSFEQKMVGRLERLEIRVDSIDSRLQRLEQKVEERLHDTRPIWHKVVADIAQLQEGQTKLQEGMEHLHVEVREIRTSQRDASRRMSVLNETLTTIQVDYRDIYDRVRGLEVNRDQPNSST
jgi:predicted  nucleic acid-binding Zn-ribbon protein